MPTSRLSEEEVRERLRLCEDDGKVQEDKAVKLQCAQVWLTGAVIYLVYLLLHVALVRSFNNSVEENSWIALGQCVIRNPLWITCWQNLLSSPSVLSGLFGTLLLGLTMALIVWYSRRLA